MPGLSEAGRLSRVLVKHARDAFRDPDAIARQWRGLNFSAAPDFARAIDEYERFLDALRRTGASIDLLPATAGVSLDSVYTRDASVVTPRGMVIAAMGKPARATEPAAQERAFREWGIPVAGRIDPPGRLEGGDVVWLDDRTVAVGRGYRTNAEGISQFAALLGDAIECVEVPLPHWRGPQDVFHLMSMVSPIDERLALVFSPLLPVPFRERLITMGFEFVEVPDAEFESMGANVLALAPRQCLALDGNPETRRRLEAAGAEVMVYAGNEISIKGGGGPTCLTRPLARAPLRR
ncbi:MAG: arginine deiminase family protein [Acidobacteriota bacterium]